MGASSILTAVTAVKIDILYKGPIFVFLSLAWRKEEKY